jgi:hypothetical protein
MAAQSSFIPLEGPAGAGAAPSHMESYPHGGGGGGGGKCIHPE